MRLQPGYLKFLKKWLHTFKTTSNAIVPVPLIWRDSVSGIFSVSMFQEGISKSWIDVICVLMQVAIMENLLMDRARGINIMVCPLAPMLKYIFIKAAQVRTTPRGLISISNCESPHISSGIAHLVSQWNFDTNIKIIRDTYWSMESCQPVLRLHLYLLL